MLCYSFEHSAKDGVLVIVLFCCLAIMQDLLAKHGEQTTEQDTTAAAGSVALLKVFVFSLLFAW